MITSSGRHIQIAERRRCLKCGSLTEQLCHKIRYQENPDQLGALIKKSYWICSICLAESEEVKSQVLPSDKVKIINKLLRMQEDYAIHSMNISSQPERLIVEITVGD